MNDQLVINGQLISYLTVGQSTAEKTVIFLHGWRSNKEVWLKVIQDLKIEKLKDLKIVSIDLPGFGGSPAPKGAWSVGDYANLVSEFITKLGLKNVILVGHSFGGRVGIKLASARLDLVKKLVLVDAAGFAMESTKKTTLGLAAKIVKPIFKPKFMQGLRKKIYKKIGAEDYVATPELTKTFVNVVSEDLTPNMKRILQPTLIIFGENDKDTPVSTAQKMKLEIINSKLEILPNAGHFSFLDKPEEFIKELNEFIKTS